MPENTITADEFNQLKTEIQNIKKLIAEIQDMKSSELPDRVTYSMDRKLSTGQFENVGVFFSISSSVPPTSSKVEYGKYIALAVESVIHQKESELNESFGLKRKTVYELMREVRKNKNIKNGKGKKESPHGVTLLSDLTNDASLDEDFQE